MAAEQVERRLWIEAPPSAVYDCFLDPARLGRWEGGTAEVDARVGGDYRVTIGAGDWVGGRFLELHPDRKLVFTWARTTPGGACTPTSKVVVSLTPQGVGTAVRIQHLPAESAHSETGDPVLDDVTLYDRHSATPDGQLRCEWCGRPGQALPFHVQSPEGEVEFAEPVLCVICQGLIGYLHPHRSERSQPPEVVEVHEWATGVVSRLLTERFRGEGRPRPDWAYGPGWNWPPAARNDRAVADEEPR